MKNQFFYTAIRPAKAPGESPVELEESFNLNTVIRSGYIEAEDGSLQYIVLLNDLHELAENVPDIDPKTGKIKGVKRQKSTVQSQILLRGDDVRRFKEATSVL